MPTITTLYESVPSSLCGPAAYSSVDFHFSLVKEDREGKVNERDNAGMLDTVDEFEVGALEDSRDTLKLEGDTSGRSKPPLD